jgi:LCP family protein required for cell wall assembly
LELNTAAPGGPTGPPPPAHPRSRLKRALLATGLALFTLGAMGFGVALYFTHRFTGKRHLNPIQTTVDMVHLVNVSFNPEQTFPGRHRINILCLGLDRNWTRDDQPYTKNSRSDTMMVASLDLDRRSASVLSIPRDTRVPLPGAGLSKINDAHARGGIPYTVQTVEDFLGVKIDYHVVIKQEAIQGTIDRLGGLGVKVEKQMDYDDNWGHLHIHLKPGAQVLSGEQVVGYMRYRHDRDGDFGRIRRQQQVVQVLADQLKNPTVLFRMPELFDVLNEHVKTNLRRDQILALGRMFYHVRPEDLVTASLSGNAVTRDDLAYVEPDEKKKELLVDWLINGNEQAANALISVEVLNRSGSARLGRQTLFWLKEAGFHVWYGRTRVARGDSALPVSEAIERGTLARSGRRVLSSLGLQGKVRKEVVQRRGADVTLVLGKDAARSPTLAATIPEDADLQASSSVTERQAPTFTTLGSRDGD